MYVIFPKNNQPANHHLYQTMIRSLKYICLSAPSTKGQFSLQLSATEMFPYIVSWLVYAQILLYLLTSVFFQFIHAWFT